MCFGLVTTVVSVVSSSEEDELPSDEVSSTLGVVFVSFFLSCALQMYFVMRFFPLFAVRFVFHFYVVGCWFVSHTILHHY